MAKILVADDQESMRFIIPSLLQEKGHAVTTAEDGQQAFDLLQKENFDLVVADVNMPQLNGLEFLKQVREKKPKQKVVFITGVLEETVRLGAEKLGLDGLLLKPFEKPDVLALIDKVLAR